MSKLIGWYRDEDGQMRVEEGVFNPIDNTYTFTQKIEYYTDPITASMSITLMGNGEVFFNGQIIRPQADWQTIRKEFDGLLSAHQRALKAYENVMNRETEKAAEEAYAKMLDFVRRLSRV